MAQSRAELTQLILAQKLKKGLRWAQLAEALGRSREWTTAACLGQARLDRAEAERLGAELGLDEQSVTLLQTAPCRGGATLVSQPDSDPMLYRFHEVSA